MQTHPQQNQDSSECSDDEAVMASHMSRAFRQRVRVRYGRVVVCREICKIPTVFNRKAYRPVIPDRPVHRASECRKVMSCLAERGVVRAALQSFHFMLFLPLQETFIRSECIQHLLTSYNFIDVFLCTLSHTFLYLLVHFGKHRLG